jgi:hypothetical protein
MMEIPDNPELPTPSPESSDERSQPAEPIRDRRRPIKKRQENTAAKQQESPQPEANNSEGAPPVFQRPSKPPKR